MKYLDSSKLKTFLFFIVLAVFVLIVFVVVFKIVFRHSDEEKTEYVTLQKAPQSALYRDNKMYISYTGFSYEISENGNLEVELNGEKYIVRQDGSVLKSNNDGTYLPVYDQAVLNDVLVAALKARSEDQYVNSLLREDVLLNRIDTASLSDSNISDFSSIFGIDKNELQKKVDTYKADTSFTFQDILGELDLTRLSEKDLESLSESLDIDKSVLAAIVYEKKEEGKTISLEEALSEIVNQDDRLLLESFLNVVGSNDFFRSLGFDKLNADMIFEQLEKSYNSKTGKPYTLDEFMHLSFKDGIVKALETIGFSVKRNEDGFYAPEKKSTDYVDDGAKITFLQEENYNPSEDLTFLANTIASAETPKSSYDQQNSQREKQTFLMSQQNGTNVTYAESELNMITAGTVINGTLISGINTDLPGQITAIVSQNVYDSFNQTNLLIPKGSRLVATYDSSVSWGQNRILVAWNMLIRPDGVIVELNGYQGTDSAGYSGQGGKVNNHVASIIGATTVAGVLDYLGSAITGGITNSLLNLLVSGAGNAVNDVASEYLERVINRQPTITVPGGTKISILVNDNVVLPLYR